MSTAYTNDGLGEHLDEMPFTLHGKPASELQNWFWQGLKAEMHRQGHAYRPEIVDDIRLVVNFTRLDEPQPFRRKAQGTFVVTIVEDTSDPADIIRAGYPVLVRALSNLGIYLVPVGDRVIAHFLTMEQGHYIVELAEDESEERFFGEVYERLAPLATSQLVINNEYLPDLPAALWDGDEITRQLTWAGEQLGDLALLPAPWPIQEILSDRDLKHVMRLFGIGGLSYGNLSARYDDQRFWMSASGVDKTNLREIGRDILMVSDYVRERNAMVLSVPPHIQPRRVSVDAIEHFMIYREHPTVGAIIHIHAWMDGIDSTHINFPCGTRELAVAVSDLVRNAPDPSRAVVGLKNHGMTLTGHSLPEIFERIEGKIIPQVPMS
ncbi:MAG TPA: class II aldolase/adducin family protein [Thermomicrobiales bacterium]|nr:class II aldolase/adducin family protein [Thermomicrobiales bacterium]